MLTSKLIDGTFPDYQRVIPTGNDKRLTVDRETFAKAVDRVSTISSERGRAVKLAAQRRPARASVTNPDSGSATEELEVDYEAGALDIGFNARYLLDITGQLDGDTAAVQARRPRLADPDPGPRSHAGALRADADAGVMPSRCAAGTPLPGRERGRGEGPGRRAEAEQAPPERPRPHPVALRANSTSPVRER